MNNNYQKPLRKNAAIKPFTQNILLVLMGSIITFRSSFVASITTSDNGTRKLALSASIIASLLFSCHPSTESKLSEAVKEQYRYGFKLRGEQEEMMSVDNVTYRLGDSSIYFLYRYGLEADNFVRLTDLYKQDLDMHLWDLLKKLDSDRDRSMARNAFLEKRMYGAAKGNYVYKVKYHVKYKTSAEGVDKVDSMYLHYPDLNFVYLNVDSLSGL